MSDNEVFPVPKEWAERAIMDGKAYEAAGGKALLPSNEGTVGSR